MKNPSHLVHVRGRSKWERMKQAREEGVREARTQKERREETKGVGGPLVYDVIPSFLPGGRGSIETKREVRKEASKR